MSGPSAFEARSGELDWILDLSGDWTLDALGAGASISRGSGASGQGAEWSGLLLSVRFPGFRLNFESSGESNPPGLGKGAFVVSIVTTVRGMQRPVGGWHHDGHMLGMHFGWWIFFIAVVVLVVWLVVRGGSGRAEGTRADPSSSDAEEILRRRFAEGEIDQEEYQERLRELRSG